MLAGYAKRRVRPAVASCFRWPRRSALTGNQPAGTRIVANCQPASGAYPVTDHARRLEGVL